MADTTLGQNPDGTERGAAPTARAGHKGADVAGLTNPRNKAPADQVGYDPKDATRWGALPGAAARANNYPRAS